MPSIRYVDSDDGNDTTGDGTELNQWKTWNKAWPLIATGDLIMLGGDSDDTSIDVTSGTYISDSTPGDWVRNPADTGQYQLVMSTGTSTADFEITSSLANFSGVHFKFTPSLSYSNALMEFDCTSLAFIDCKFSMTTTHLTAEPRWANGSSSTRDFSFSFFGCEFDSNGSATRLGHGFYGGVFIDCDFHGHTNTGTSSSNDAFIQVSSGTPYFSRCRFYDNNHGLFLYFPSGSYQGGPKFDNCSWYYSSSDTNATYFVSKPSGATENDWSAMYFHSCIIENDSGQTLDFVNIGSSTFTQPWTGILCGKNVFRNVTIDSSAYAPNTSFPDTVSTVSNFESIVVGNPNFLRLTDDADARNHSLNEQTDAGAYQAAETGLPAVAASDLREGVDRGDLVLGTLKVPAAGKVIKGTAVDAGLGTYKQLPVASGKLAEQWGANDTEFTGEYEAVADHADPVYVVWPHTYDDGNKQGLAGKINANELEITADIKTNALAHIAKYLLSPWKELPYQDELDLNEGNQNKKRYGIQVGDLVEANANTNIREVTRTFTLVLRDKFPHRGSNDTTREAATRILNAKSEEIRRLFDESNAGSFKSVMMVGGYNEFKPEFGKDNTITVLMDFDVTYSVNNK